MTDRIGQQLGNYRLVRLLGEGGFAEVYLGEHIYLKTQVAVKVLHLHLVQEEFSGFLQEAQTIAHLKHPHIISVFDFGIDGVPFLVMNYLPQGSLRERYPHGTSVPLSTIVPYVNQVTAALQYAHDMKVIHRDVKPANMLMRSNDQIILSDFGIATAAHRTTSLQTMNSTGSPSYMAPEHIAGKPRPASDQYSLAIVVYEWLCGKLPFQGEPLAVMYKQTYDAVPSLREQVPTMAPEVEQVVLTALAKDPQQRFASIQAFANALEQVSRASSHTPLSLNEASQPINAHPILSQSAISTELVTPPSQSSLPPETVEEQSPQAPPATTPPSFPVPLLAPLLSQSFQPTKAAMPSSPVTGVPPITNEPLALDPGQAAYEERASDLNQSPLPTPVVTPPSQAAVHPEAVAPPRSSIQPIVPIPAPRQSGEPTLPSASSPPPPPLPPITRGSQASAVPQPSQHHISRRAILVGMAGIAVVGSGGLTWLAISHRQQVSSTSPSSTATPSPTTAPTATPSPPALPLGTTLHIYRGHSSDVLAVAWSPDNKHIASGSYDKTVQVWDAADGGHPFIYRGHSDEVFGVAWSPDNKHIASGGLDYTVQVWDAADGGHPFIYHGHSYIVVGVAWSPDNKRIASGSYDYTAQVWDAADGGHPFIYRGHSSPVFGVAWSPDGKRIASGSSDTTVQVWDAADGGHPFIYHGHSDSVFGVAWSPDGKRIASGSSDKTVQVWDATDGGHAYTYRGHSDRIWAVAWSPDGKRIASGSSDYTAQVWDATDGSHAYTYRAHSSAVLAVVWSPDGKRIASGSVDTTVQVWQA